MSDKKFINVTPSVEDIEKLPLGERTAYYLAAKEHYRTFSRCGYYLIAMVAIALAMSLSLMVLYDPQTGLSFGTRITLCFLPPMGMFAGAMLSIHMRESIEQLAAFERFETPRGLVAGHRKIALKTTKTTVRQPQV